MTRAGSSYNVNCEEPEIKAWTQLALNFGFEPDGTGGQCVVGEWRLRRQNALDIVEPQTFCANSSFKGFNIEEGRQCY
jgi:hypothetical protein